MRVTLGDLPVWRGVQASPGYRSMPFAFVCQEGLVRLDLPPRQARDLLWDYGRDDYSFISTPPGLSSWANQHGDKVVDILAGWVGDLAGKEVLEIGAGTLYVAQMVMARLGAARYLACDPALREDAIPDGVEVLRDYFSPRAVGKQSFDLAICPVCLEHIPDPWEFLRGVAELLAPRRGQLYLEVPQCRTGLETGDIGICVHEHLNYFTATSLQGLLAQCGLAVRELRVTSDAIFALAQAGRQTDPDRAWQEEAPWLLERFASGFRANLERADSLIQDLGAAGPLALHGCGVALNNVLGLLGHQENGALHLFDGDSFKTGKYLPAHFRPIEDSRSHKYKTMRSVIVGAPMFYRDIAGWVGREHGIRPQDIHCIMPVAAGAPGE